MDKHYFNIIEPDDGRDVVIEVFGTIGESWWGESVTFKDVSEQLKKIASSTKKVLVKINSYGGDVNDALAIFELLRSMGDRVTTECVGFCASAATIIAMAGHVRRMSSYGLFLVHKCSSGAWGNENDLAAELESQRKVNDRIVKLYEDVTGCDRGRLEALMNEDNGNGIWLNVDEAMEYGFITEAIPDTMEDKGKKAFYEAMFQKLFNNHKKYSDMKKSIIAFAALAALLAVNEVDGKDNKALLDDEQLKKVNDHIGDLSTQLATAKAEAEKAKQEAQAEVGRVKDEADAEKARLQAKVAELQAVIDKTPADQPPAGGSDTKTDKVETFEDWYNQQSYVQEAKRELGM